MHSVYASYFYLLQFDFICLVLVNAIQYTLIAIIRANNASM